MKEFLSQRGVPYDEVDISRDAEAAQDIQRRTGRMAVPVTEIDGNLVVGFDQPQLEHFLSQARPSAPPFGVAVADAAKYLSGRGLAPVSGAYVGAVKPNLPAAAAGLKGGDIITRIDASAVNNAADVHRALSGLQKGAFIRITFLRDGQPRQAEARL